MQCKFLLILGLLFNGLLSAEETVPTRIEKVDSDGAKIDLHIFIPAQPNTKRSAILLFHGGGWTEGDATWVYGQAERYNQLGMVAIAVDYRLSDQKQITPFDAVADARNAVRWVRQQAANLNVDRHKIVALGTSAGGHLVAATAVFSEPYGNDESAQPNALVLRSAAVAVSNSNWFRELTGGPAQAAALSPDRYIRAGLPPTLILQGEKDNVTPAQGAINFCDRMRAQKSSCQIEIYAGVGHLFTRNLQNQEIPDYDAIDQEVSKNAGDKTVAFLREQGFLN